MKKLLPVLALLCLFQLVGAQEIPKFRFSNTLRDTTMHRIDYDLAGAHFLGSTVARKFYLLDEVYSYIEKGTPTSPGDKKIIRKPTVFYAIKKVNNLYKKEVKSGNIDINQAAQNMKYILDVGFCIFSQDTGEFEKALKTYKKPAEIEQLFMNVELR